ncbi:MAG: bifunctional (p)ppGpp synthetase/guanosine-3',5'-bis(diphosphate) 3'-pyrophosphohydrolase, partial [Clostridia bacterium]
MPYETAEITIENLKAKLKHYYPINYKLLNEAFNLAYAAHADQKRASGRPYITHPVVVADILVDLGLDVPAICAALLHDTVEDTYVTDEMLRERFGDEIADLVKGVTKLDKIQFRSKEEEQAENIRKMFIAMAKDIRVLIIKLADRLHNMRSLQFLSPDRQAIMARETLDIYAPLAGRLGISPIKCELEDLALKYLDRTAYDYLADNIALKKEERREIVDVFIMEINKLLEEMNVVGEVFGRTKHFYSIYKKMKNQNKTLDQIYDLTAVRVIVGTVKDCYNVLGIIHSTWIPMPGRVKDYIAAPKPNLYQSLHTTVIASGTPIEIQIRTREMHQIAEFGIAAHWKYKESNGSNYKMGDNLKWIQDVLNYGSELSDSHEFLDIIRKDIRVTNEVYVFTPKGDVRKLITGATALDFAYAIHSEVGNKCVGAKVNTKIATLDTVLETGDVVEILINQNSKGPSRDWLKIVKTSGAKAKIRQFFKRELKDEYIKDGKSMLEREAKTRGFTWANISTPEALKTVFDRYSYTSIDEMYASVGYGGVSVHQVIMKLLNTMHAMQPNV